MRSLWTTSFSLQCGFRYLECVFSIVLGCPGLCLDVLLICMTAGVPLAGQGVLQYRKWCLHAFFGVYGGEMNNRNFEDKERAMGEIFLCSLFFDTLYLWTAAYVSPLSISFSDFLVRFNFALLVRRFILYYTSYVLRSALRFQ
jgi:hypothetical protein